MSRIAVVGAGIAGLATSWLLSRRHDVLLFERSDRLGGHTHTHHVNTQDGPLALDTGFLVHNDRTYPLLVRMFDEIGVTRRPSDMTFAVANLHTGFEFSTRGVLGMLPTARSWVSPSHYAFVLEVLRFQRVARALASSGAGADVTLGAFLTKNRFHGPAVERFVLPLASAIWSTSPEAVGDFPAAALVTFMHHHGMLTVLGHPTWWTLEGGCSSYIPRLMSSPRIQVHMESPPRSIRRAHDGVTIRLDASELRVDEVVFACHGDEVLPMLANPSPAEREVLGAFRTSRNDAWLHTDPWWLPRRRHTRAAWNYLIGEDPAHATVTYHLNALQGLETKLDYCVTLNPPRPIRSLAVLARMEYTHPLYTQQAIAAQARWSEISGLNRTHYCGAYWFYGFHEDGLRSAARVAAKLGVQW